MRGTFLFPSRLGQGGIAYAVEPLLSDVRASAWMDYCSAPVHEGLNASFQRLNAEQVRAVRRPVLPLVWSNLLLVFCLRRIKQKWRAHTGFYAVRASWDRDDLPTRRYGRTSHAGRPAHDPAPRTSARRRIGRLGRDHRINCRQTRPRPQREHLCRFGDQCEPHQAGDVWRGDHNRAAGGAGEDDLGPALGPSEGYVCGVTEICWYWAEGSSFELCICPKP